MIIANENTKYQLKQITTEIIYILNTELNRELIMRMIVFPLVTFQASIYLGGRESALTLCYTHKISLSRETLAAYL